MYSYASGDLLEKPNTYFYTSYFGRPFLTAWEEARKGVVDQINKVISPPKTKATLTFAVFEQNIFTEREFQTSDFLEMLYGELISDSRNLEIKKWLNLLVKKFEVSKRLYKVYDHNFKAENLGVSEAYADVALYVRAAEIFEAAYTYFGDLPYLNVLLKIVDTLSSIIQSVDESQTGRVKWVILREQEHIKALMKNFSVS